MSSPTPVPTGEHPIPSTEQVVVHVFGRTDVGRMREHNEDAFVVADLTRGQATLQPEVRSHVVGERGTLFMVCDGMGGAAAGEIASAMAIDAILREITAALASEDAPNEDAFATAIKRATSAANAEIHMFAVEHPEFRGMGTTATVAGVLGDAVYLAQVGDSRAYLVRGGVAQQITKDQSLMQKLVEAGELTEEEAAQSERRNIILQALGPEPQIKIDLTHQQLRRGDVLVLCSDGLSGQVRTDEIARIVSEDEDPMTACKRLIDLANDNGGPDNITVIVARFDGDGLIMPGATDPVGHRVFPLQTDSGPVPAIELRVSRGTLTTGAIPMQRRPTREIPAPPPADPIVLTSSLRDDPLSSRRSRGMLVAMLLLLLFLAMATWWVYRSAQSIVEERHAGQATTTTPAAAPAAQRPATPQPATPGSSTPQPATKQGAPANVP
ncbi:MAG TPA: Stp1/IreP family PP2C-type Ser/Thr phosphatase [Gemmatimonadaceae bacterium]|nr:Stp1/IreP family PP2C-type Ser/Thr phosphatase [Gemmatimonadaceae bacterium]